MDTWIERIRDNNMLISTHAATEEEIDNAEKKLGLSFADEYKTFLLTVGAAICFSHEINGIVDNVNLDVVSATEKARSQLDLIPHAWYAIEDTHYDGIVVLQDKRGTVYQMEPGIIPVKLANSLENYLFDATSATRGAPAACNSEAEIIERKTPIEEVTKKVLEKSVEVSRKKLDDPNQVEKILQQMEKKLELIPGVGDWLADVPSVVSLIRSYIRKEYKDISVGSIIAALAAIIYMVSPVDLIPDSLPGVGMIDDAAVFVMSWKMIHDDVIKYQEWRKETGRDTKEAKEPQ